MAGHISKQAAGTWGELLLGLFGHTPKPVPGEEAWNREMINKALRAALLTGGAGALLGAGVRGAQEVGKSFEEEGVGTMAEPVVINIKRPKQEKKRVKTAKYEHPVDWPLALPLWLTAGGLGAYGGYHGAKSIADAIRARLLKQDEEAAKREFEDALKAQYEASEAKTASHDPVTRAITNRIDEHYERFRKQADFPSPGVVGGMGLTAMLALWALAHHNAYKRLKKTDPEALQLKIMDRQAKLRQLGSPPPVMFNIEDEPSKEAGVTERPFAKRSGIADSAASSVHGFESLTPGVAGIASSAKTMYPAKAPAQSPTVTAAPAANSNTQSGKPDANPLQTGATELAQDRNGLMDAAKMISNSPEVQQGMNEGAMDFVRSTPVLNMLFPDKKASVESDQVKGMVESGVKPMVSGAKGVEFGKNMTNQLSGKPAPTPAADDPISGFTNELTRSIGNQVKESPKLDFLPKATFWLSSLFGKSGALTAQQGRDAGAKFRGSPAAKGAADEIAPMVNKTFSHVLGQSYLGQGLNMLSPMSYIESLKNQMDAEKSKNPQPAK